MSEIKLPVVVKDDVLDLRNGNVLAEVSKNNSARLKREERSPSLRSVSHTALEVKHKILGDYDQEKMEQRHITALKNLGRNRNVSPVQKTSDERRQKFRSRTLDPRFRRSRSPSKKVTNSQSISAIKPTHIKVHHRPRSMQSFSNSAALYAMEQIMDKENGNVSDFLISNDPYTETEANIQINEKGTMTENVDPYKTENPPFENFLINDGSGEKLYTKDSYWNDPRNLDKALKPPLVRAKSSIASFTTRKSLEKVEKNEMKICPRCRHSISEDDNDASTYVFDDATEVTDIQPIFTKITEKINNLIRPLEETKLDFSKFLVGYITALIIVTVTIGVFILLDPTSLLEFIENSFYEQPSEPEIPETEESFLDILTSAGTSLLSRVHNVLDNIVNVLTTKRKQTIQAEEVLKNNEKWWLF